MNLIATSAPRTMTSRELAAISEKRHDNVMRVCRDLRDSGVCPQIEETPYVEPAAAWAICHDVDLSALFGEVAA